MVGSTGLSRFFQATTSSKTSETILIDNVDASLAIEGNARSPGVSALLSIITDPLRQVVILISTVDDPFKCLGASSAGKTIRSSITLRVHIGCLRSSNASNASNESVSKKKTRGDVRAANAVKAVKAANDQHLDTLYVLALEAAAGYHSNDSLLAVAYDMRRILLNE
jgi:hypothetical protein